MKTMSKRCPNISSQSRPLSRRCSCPAERKKDGGKLDYDSCADSYQSQTVKKNEKSLKLDGTTSSVILFGRRGKIKTFSTNLTYRFSVLALNTNAVKQSVLKTLFKAG